MDLFCVLQYGETPLHMAAKNGSNEAVKMLLAHGALVEAKANVCIRTASVMIELEHGFLFSFSII